MRLKNPIPDVIPADKVLGEEAGIQSFLTLCTPDFVEATLMKNHPWLPEL
jgi:hypothetical protein